MNGSSRSKPLLIIGAGISGLTLAQACRKYDLPYLLFERDASATSRSAGWGLTLNWSLDIYRSLLPQDILDRLPDTYVNGAAVDAGEKGSFTFFDLSTGEAKWKVPITGERIRVSRERLKRLMLSGLDVQWGKTLVDSRKADDGSNDVTATFSDSTEATGCLLVGCDGARSQVRRLCHPDDYENQQLPIRFIGAGVLYPESQIAEIRKLDPFFLQGSDPEKDVFMWFSFLDTPSDPSSMTTLSSYGEHRDHTIGDGPLYRCQIMISWPYRPGFNGRAEPTEMPNTRNKQLGTMQSFAWQFVEPFKSIVGNIPWESEVKEVLLADWLPRPTSSTEMGKSLGGRVCLVGDAAHAMVMYRGEGANHAIVDVGRLIGLLRPLMRDGEGGHDDDAWRTAVEEYETEMIERSSLGVLASRQACMDAHDYKRLNDNSPLVRRRLMRADL